MAGSEVKADLWVNETITPWDIYSHGVTRIFMSKRTPYQEMIVVETGAYGKALVLDGKWQSCTGDEFLYHEPLVHPALLLNRAPKEVLILGGGEGATSREVLRWKTIERVTMVDIDEDVVDACKKHLPEMHQGAFDDPRHELLIQDAVEFLAQTDRCFDVVISDLSDPIEDGPSFKFFTKEYFARVKELLTDDGVLVIQAGPVSPIGLPMHARLARTMREVYPHTHSYSSHIPNYAAPWSFILGSSNPINRRPDPDETDRLLLANTTGGLRMFDGITHLGIFQLPAHIRQAIETEVRIYTLNEPPKFFGQGALAGRGSTHDND